MQREQQEQIAQREEELRRNYFKKFIGRNKELLEYHNRYYYNVPDRFEEIDEAALLSTLEKARIAIIGDIHYSTQAKKSIRNLLLKYIDHAKTNSTPFQAERHLIFALEVIDDDNIRHLGRYIAGELNFAAFCKAAQFHRHWGLDFETYYRPLFEFMREHHLQGKPLFVDPGKARGNIKARDVLMAKRILAYHREAPEATIVVIVGDWHSSQAHLQAEIDKHIAADPACKGEKLAQHVYSYYLNHERIWEWKKEVKNHATQYFKLSSQVYAIADTRPDVKFFSLYDHHKIGQDVDPDDLMDDGLYQHIFSSIVRDLADLLGLDLESIGDWTDKIEIFTPHIRDQFLSQLREKKRELKFISQAKLEEVKVQVAKFGSCFIPVSPTANYLYISSTCTPNQYAQMATRYLRDNFIPKIKTRGERNKFYLKIIDEALRFVGNKLINHYVECNEIKKHERSIRKLSKQEDLTHAERVELRSAQLVFSHLKAEKAGLTQKFFTSFMAEFYAVPKGGVRKQKQYEIYLACIRSLGRLLGDEIYRRAEHIPENEQRAYFHAILLKDYGQQPVEDYYALKFGATSPAPSNIPKEKSRAVGQKRRSRLE